LHEGVLVEWPSSTGKHTPVFYGPDAVMMVDTGDEARMEAAGLLAAALCSEETVRARVGIYKYVPLAEFTRFLPMPREVEQMTKLINTGGTFNMGAGYEKYRSLRNLWASALQRMFLGVKTPTETAEWFAQRAAPLLK